MEYGTLNLKTNGGERKMHYIKEGNDYFMSTGINSKKVEQIKADPNVSINLNESKYQAKIIEDEAIIKKYGSLLKDAMPSIMKFIVKLKNTSNNIIIKLESSES